jgi:L-threonylcarbamoyladenylate synthase
MITQVIRIDRKKIQISKLKKAAEILKNGGIAVFPTDTVYGLCANAFDLNARKKIYKLKGRSFHKPLIVMAGSTKDLQSLAVMNEAHLRLAKKYWPGQLTLVLASTAIGTMVMGGRSNLGARIPDCKVALALMKMCGFPLVTTSANKSGKESIKSGKEAVKEFTDKVDLIIDAGLCGKRQESTVMDVTHFPYVVIREGYLKKKDIEKFEVKR